MPHGSFAAFKATLARKKARDDKKVSLYDKNRKVYRNSTENIEYNFPKLTASEWKMLSVLLEKS